MLCFSTLFLSHSLGAAPVQRRVLRSSLYQRGDALWSLSTASPVYGQASLAPAVEAQPVALCHIVQVDKVHHVIHLVRALFTVARAVKGQRSNVF